MGKLKTWKAPPQKEGGNSFKLRTPGMPSWKRQPEELLTFTCPQKHAGCHYFSQLKKIP